MKTLRTSVAVCLMGVFWGCGGGDSSGDGAAATGATTTSSTSNSSGSTTAGEPTSSGAGGATSTASGTVGTQGAVSTDGAVTTTGTTGSSGGGFTVPPVPAGCATILPNGCDVVEVATGLEQIGAFNLTATHLYWRAGDNVMRAPVVGGDAEILYEGILGLTGLAVDDARAYVTASGSIGVPLVASFPINGGELTVLDEEATQPFDIEVSDGTLYYTVASADDTGGVYALPVDGGTPQRLAAGSGVILQPWGDYVYYSSIDAQASLSRVPRGGGAPELILESVQSAHFFVNETGVYLNLGYDVVRVPHAGGTPEVLTLLERSPTELGGPVLDTTHAYFLDNEGYSGDLVRVALDGSDRTVLWTNDQSMRSIAANDTTLFFAENISGGRILSVDKCGCP